MDCDDVSLPDSDALEEAYRESQSRRRIAMFTREIGYDLDDDSDDSDNSDYSDDDEEGETDTHSVSGILLELQQQNEPIATLLASHLNRARRREVRSLLIALAKTPRDVARMEHVDRCLSLMHFFNTIGKAPVFSPDYTQLRVLELVHDSIKDKHLPWLSLLVQNAWSLRLLDLSSNKLGLDAETLSELGRSIGRSAIRTLCLNNNPMSRKSFVSFLAAIQWDGCCLEKLQLSCTQISELLKHGSDGVDDDLGELYSARAVARLISSDSKCRRLRVLSLNANDFGIKGWRAIFAALVGTVWGPYELPREDVDLLRSAKRDGDISEVIPRSELRPNRCLQHLDLTMANVRKLAASGDEVSDATAPGSLRAFLREAPPDRRRCVLQYLQLQRQVGQISRGRPDDNDSGDASVEAIIARAGGDAAAWHEEYREAVETESGVHLLDWRTLLAARTRLNRKDAEQVRAAALRVLKAARVLGCRARMREAVPPSGLSRFWQLPPEVRILVVRHLDDEAALSEQQFLEVVSYAQEWTTIGYGSVTYDWRPIMAKSVDPTVKEGPQDSTESKGTEALDDSGGGIDEKDLLRARVIGALEKELGQCLRTQLAPRDLILREPPKGAGASMSLPCHEWSWADCFRLRSPPLDWPAEPLTTEAQFRGADPAKLAFWSCTTTDAPDPNMPFVGQPFPSPSINTERPLSTGTSLRV
ncbi:hypothetical protein ACQY0O_006413 [Thecaphora frezii]